MNRTHSIILLIIFVALGYKFWDFDIAWYWALIMSYVATSILFGLFAMYENSKKPPFNSVVFFAGFAWPMYMIGGFGIIESDHNRTGADHKN